MTSNPILGGLTLSKTIEVQGNATGKGIAGASITLTQRSDDGTSMTLRHE